MNYFLTVLLPAAGTAVPVITLLFSIWKVLKKLASEIVTKPMLTEALTSTEKHQTESTNSLKKQLLDQAAETKAALDLASLQTKESLLVAAQTTKQDMAHAIREGNDLQLQQINGTYLKPNRMWELLEPHLMELKSLRMAITLNEKALQQLEARVAQNALQLGSIFKEVWQQSLGSPKVLVDARNDSHDQLPPLKEN